MAPLETRSTVAVGGQPIYSTFVQFPVVCFTLTLLTDIAYWRTFNLMWQNFSSWLLFAGLVFGALAVIVGIIDFAVRPAIRASRPAWLHVIGSVVVLVLALLNSLVHAGDGWTAIVPWGLTLSVITVVVMIITDWLGRSMVYRHGAGVSHHA
ncbi:DUF2231 domain-containing protein [Aquibium oceanicum]|uniref:DUF2231 domain-containing protein n=1 Tax=Aquibium oceanicum TaxID=1670800 RepID=A0A1L3SZA2_9HYPH|nr:DUF2231 domain-containing protein [Aquibium oceanicum]APH74746.1 hypothetical protein BSQ44_21515 [Aquibium oceanicum]